VRDRTIKVAIVQAEVADSLDAGLELTRVKAIEAGKAGAELIVFPETWIPGYPAWLDLSRDAALWDHAPVKGGVRPDRREQHGHPGPALDHLAETARQSQATLGGGLSERVDRGAGRGTLYNSLITIGPTGGCSTTPQADADLYRAADLGRGRRRGLRAVDTPAGRVSALVCWEHWMPLARQALHESGEDCARRGLADGARSPPGREPPICVRGPLLRARLRRLDARLLASARSWSLTLIGSSGPEQWLLRGGSAVIGPDGKYIAGPVYDEPALLTGRARSPARQRGKHDPRCDRALSPPRIVRLPTAPHRQALRRRGRMRRLREGTGPGRIRNVDRSDAAPRRFRS
jgi:predicted amidohydrolase